jgi:hypothetical protein
MVSGVLMRFIQFNKGVHLQYLCKACVMGKIAVRVVQKVIHQQCCLKQQYTEQWKIPEL